MSYKEVRRHHLVVENCLTWKPRTTDGGRNKEACGMPCASLRHVLANLPKVVVPATWPRTAGPQVAGAAWSRSSTGGAHLQCEMVPEDGLDHPQLSFPSLIPHNPLETCLQSQKPEEVHTVIWAHLFLNMLAFSFSVRICIAEYREEEKIFYKG